MRRLIILFTIIFSSLLWWGVYTVDSSNQKTTVNFFQDMQRDILRVAQSSLDNWFDEQLLLYPEMDLNNLGQEYYSQFSSPISPVTYGDIFVFKDGVPIFDSYRIFTEKYPDQTIKEFMEIQAETYGAEHYYQLVDELTKNSEGQGWWIWDAQRRGIEQAAWLPLTVNGETFMILLTTPEELVYDVASVSQNKLYYVFIASIANILLILVFIFLYYWQERKLIDALAESGSESKLKDIEHELEKAKIGFENKAEELKKVNEELESAMNLLIDKDYKINELQDKLKDKSV
ncbi:hypothetical protein ISR92_01885 [Patescibacteria group bacterium]|nr:hypothetical protein [Patescibacteria group bacterium]